MSASKFELKHVQGVPVSDEELLSDIRRVAETAGAKSVSSRLYRKLGAHSDITASNRFGTWNKAVLAAGLEVANEINITDDRLFENLMRLWEHYGRQPRRRETANPPSKISEGPYIRRFRSWTNTLKQFIEYANSQGARLPAPAQTASGRRTGRDPSRTLRFRVLKRDNFSCRACGASPALRPGLSLHVDHIKPWSRGGETAEENLQTLCETCNLGKSNVL